LKTLECVTIATIQGGLKMKKTCKQIRDFVKGTYYTDIDSKTHWQPFENYTAEQVEEIVESETLSLCGFLGVNYKRGVK
jgi:hypothetical protein